MIKFTPETISAIVGVILVLVFAYFPKLRVKYGGLESEVKSGIMIGLLLLTAGVITVLSYYQIISTEEPVTWILFVKVFVSALIANQPTYSILPEAKDVTEARLRR